MNDADQYRDRHHGCHTCDRGPAFVAQASTEASTPTRHTTEPIERSMPLVMMTNAAPTLRMPISAVRWTRFSTFPTRRNRSLENAVYTQIATNRPKMPQIFAPFGENCASPFGSLCLGVRGE